MGKKENFEAFVESFTQGNFEQMTNYLAEDCVFHEADVLPYGGDCVGPQGFLKLVEFMASKFSLEFLKTDLIEAGDDLLVVKMLIRWTSLRTGESFDMPIVGLHRFEDGKIVDADIYCKDAAKVAREASTLGGIPTGVEPQHAGLFTSVDDSADAEWFIELLDRSREAPDILAARQWTIEALALVPGQRILDVGCGTGEFSCDLAGRVDPGGEVIGVDCSSAMVHEATRRHPGSSLPVRFDVGDAQNLPYATGSFDAARTERMLCYVPDHRAAISEMVRVVRPGGRVAVMEVDTDVLLIDHPDEVLNHAFAASLAQTIRHPFIGRQLPRLLSEAGLVGVKLYASIFRAPYSLIELIIAEHGMSMISSGAATADALQRWREDLAEAHRAGVLFIGMPMFIAYGRKPQDGEAAGA